MLRFPGTCKVLIVALLCSALPAQALAEPRFSLQLGGAYTELDGLVPIESVLTVPVLSNPFDPSNPFTDTTLPVDGKLPFESEGGTWEVIAGWRFARHFQIQLGYADFGDFSSEKIVVSPLFSSFTSVFTPIRDYVGRGNPFIGSPGSGLTFLDPNLPPVSGTPSAGVAYLLASSTALVNLDPSAVTLGLRVDYPIVGRMRVYGRLGYLRAMFNASDTAGANFEVPDPGDENGWYWGAGVQYPLLPRVLIGGGFARYDLNLQTLDSYQLSLELLLF